MRRAVESPISWKQMCQKTRTHALRCHGNPTDMSSNQLSAETSRASCTWGGSRQPATCTNRADTRMAGSSPFLPAYLGQRAITQPNWVIQCQKEPFAGLLPLFSTFRPLKNQLIRLLIHSFRGNFCRGFEPAAAADEPQSNDYDDDTNSKVAITPHRGKHQAKWKRHLTAEREPSFLHRRIRSIKSVSMRWRGSRSLSLHHHLIRAERCAWTCVRCTWDATSESMLVFQ